MKVYLIYVCPPDGHGTDYSVWELNPKHAMQKYRDLVQAFADNPTYWSVRISEVTLIRPAKDAIIRLLNNSGDFIESQVTIKETTKRGEFSSKEASRAVR